VHRYGRQDRGGEGLDQRDLLGETDDELAAVASADRQLRAAEQRLGDGDPSAVALRVDAISSASAPCAQRRS
jgi:hypothetical protein